MFLTSYCVFTGELGFRLLVSECFKGEVLPLADEGGDGLCLGAAIPTKPA